MFSAQTRVRIKRADNQLSNPIKIELLPECYRKTDETTLTICIDHRRLFYQKETIYLFVVRQPHYPTQTVTPSSENSVTILICLFYYLHAVFQYLKYLLIVRTP